MRETVYAVLIPADEPDRFDRWSKLEGLLITFDGINHQVYSRRDHLGLLNQPAYLRFARFLVKKKKAFKLMTIKVQGVKWFK